VASIGSVRSRLETQQGRTSPSGGPGPGGRRGRAVCKAGPRRLAIDSTGLRWRGIHGVRASCLMIWLYNLRTL
jgi:hypothetical protein